ncbi:MAG: PQQ-binding-like beta-propeller repeat protein [Candidatus Sulfotelmatobacter sp.]
MASLLLYSLGAFFSFGAPIAASAQVVQWPLAGQGAANLRSQPEETFLGTSNASSLVAKWVFTTGSDVSATPTVGTTAVFFPDWSGNLYAVDLATGAQLWSHQVSEYDNEAGAVSRVSPALYNSSLIIGDSVARLTMAPT